MAVGRIAVPQSGIRSRVVVLTLGAAIVLSSPLGAASVVPRQTTPVYIATFTVAADTPTVYSGVTTFNVDKDGKVTGKMALDTPVGVDAALAGTIKGDVWTFEYTYSIPQQSCDGVVAGTGKVSKDRKLIEGAVKISGACTQSPLDATFSFAQKPAGPRAH
ncbi:MAG TPA: hypothetical protein VFV98_18625 [Vicinamibacterales bacterium]|nr:hypothetical protein [Vicinamibacterales bacterium]